MKVIGPIVRIVLKKKEEWDVFVFIIKMCIESIIKRNMFVGLIYCTYKVSEINWLSLISMHHSLSFFY